MSKKRIVMVGHQSFVPGRGPSMWDVLIDTLGVGLGMLLVSSLRWGYYHRWRQQK